MKEKLIRPPVSIKAVLATARPAVTASYAINYRGGGLDPAGYHRTNIAAHIVATLAFFGFVLYSLSHRATQPLGGSRPAFLSFVAAAIFATHPMQTESVTYISQRAEVFVTIALLGALTVGAMAANGMSQRLWLPAMLVCALFGASSKATFVVFPALLLLYDWLCVARRDVRAILSRYPIHLAALTTGVATALSTLAAVRASPSVGLSIERLSGAQYALWQLSVVPYYLRLALFPDRLCFNCGYYGPWPLESTLFGALPILGPLVLSAALLLVAYLASREPIISFSIAAFFVALLPTSSFIAVQDVYVEHRAYLSVGFLAIAVTLGADRMLTVIERRYALLRRWPRPALVAVTVGVLVTLTLARNQLYAEPITLYQHSVSLAPKTAHSRLILGRFYAEQGDYAAAVDEYRKAIEFDPIGRTGLIHVSLGVAHMKLAQYAQAAEAYEIAVQRQPRQASARRNLAVAYLRLERFDDAVRAAEAAVELEPGNVTGRKILADAYTRVGRVEDAREEYRAALRQSPNDRSVRDRLRRLEEP